MDTGDFSLYSSICTENSVHLRNTKGTLATLDFKKWYYETAKAHGTTDVPRNMAIDELPEEFREVRKKLRGE